MHDNNDIVHMDMTTDSVTGDSGQNNHGSQCSLVPLECSTRFIA